MHEEVLNIISIREIQVKITMRYHHTHTRIAIMKNILLTIIKIASLLKIYFIESTL